MTEKSDWIPIVSEPSDQFRSTLSVSPAESVRIKEVLSVSFNRDTRTMIVVKPSGTWVINIPKDVNETDVLIRCVSTGSIPAFIGSQPIENNFEKDKDGRFFKKLLH